MPTPLPQNIVDARTQADVLTAKAGEFASALPTISDELKKRVDKIYNDNADVLGLFNTGVTNLVKAPGQSYEMFDKVTDPYARERLASSFVATQALPAMTAAGQLGQRVGRINDVVDANTRAFEGQATAANVAAESARQRYLDAFNEWKTLEDIRLEQERIAAQRAANSGGGMDLSGLIKALTGDGTTPGGNKGSGKPTIDTNATWNSIVDKVTRSGGNEYHVWKAIDDLAKSGVDVGDLWKRHASLKQQRGTNPLNSGIYNINLPSNLKVDLSGIRGGSSLNTGQVGSIKLPAGFSF